MRDLQRLLHLKDEQAKKISDEICKFSTADKLTNIDITTYGSFVTTILHNLIEEFINLIGADRHENINLLLEKLKTTINLVDETDFTFNESKYKSFLNKIMGNKNKVIKKYQNITVNIEEIYFQFAKISTKLQRETAKLEEIATNNNFFLEIINVYINTLQNKLLLISEPTQIPEERVGARQINSNEHDKKERDNIKLMLQQRLDYFVLLKTITKGNSEQIKLIVTSNFNLMTQINDAIVKTLPILKNSINDLITFEQTKVAMVSLQKVTTNYTNLLAEQSQNLNKRVKFVNKLREQQHSQLLSLKKDKVSLQSNISPLEKAVENNKQLYKYSKAKIASSEEVINGF